MISKTIRISPPDASLVTTGNYNYPVAIVGSNTIRMRVISFDFRVIDIDSISDPQQPVFTKIFVKDKSTVDTMIADMELLTATWNDMDYASTVATETYTKDSGDYFKYVSNSSAGEYNLTGNPVMASCGKQFGFSFYRKQLKRNLFIKEGEYLVFTLGRKEEDPQVFLMEMEVEI